MPSDYYCYECNDQHMYRCPKEVIRTNKAKGK